MNNYETEKVVYLTGLIVALAALASIFGLPSVEGVTLFLVGMVLTWRLGVILDPAQKRESEEGQFVP